MARPATGSVVEPKGIRKSWAIRFRVNGERKQVTLGKPEDGWSRERAETELANVLADVRRGIWSPPEPEPISDHQEPGETFLEFSSAWFNEREPGWRESSRIDVKWALERHLLPVFGELRLDAITVEAVDKFARAKQREGRLGNNSIRKVLQHGAAVMEQAVEWERVTRNPFKGRKKLIPAKAPKRTRVEPEQLPALLRACKPHLRPLVATLAGCGLRISEALALTWGDVNLAEGVIRVRESKTDAGVRAVHIPLGLGEELRTYKAHRKPRPTDRVFRNITNTAPMGVRTAESALKTAVKKADAQLVKLGIEPIGHLTPHGLRRTYASLRFGAGDDPVYVMEQGGWTDLDVPMGMYAKAIRRREHLTGTVAREFNAALEWAQMGAKGPAPDFTGTAIPLPERPSARPVA